MLTIDKVETAGFEAAIRGMRNPMNSWDKSDSTFQYMRKEDKEWWRIGEKDLDLMKRLAKSGTDHRKYLRMIAVYMDITAPLYWWKEFDTYKVGTVANSCSTMHKIQAKEFVLDDFSCEHLQPPMLDILKNTIQGLNDSRDAYLASKDILGVYDKLMWWQMIQLLPSSYNQKRTVMFSYEAAANMYSARKHHKLDEWHVLCNEIENLPYFSEIFDLEEN